MFPRRKRTTLREAISAYLDTLTLAGHAKSTLDNREYLLARLARHLGTESEVGAIREPELIAYLAEFRRESSASYATLIAKVVRAFCAWLVEQGYLDKEPLGGIKFKEPRPTPVVPFRQDELDRLVAVAETGLEKAALALLIDCGLRASELTSLRWQDVELVKRTILIRYGKGAKSRQLALNDSVRDALACYLRESPQVNGTVWPLPFDRKRLERMLDRLGQRAGVSRVYPHRFRHTWATRMLQGGMDPLALKVLGGWSTLAMVERYTALIAEERAIEEHRRHAAAI